VGRLTDRASGVAAAKPFLRAGAERSGAQDNPTPSPSPSTLRACRSGPDPTRTAWAMALLARWTFHPHDRDPVGLVRVTGGTAQLTGRLTTALPPGKVHRTPTPNTPAAPNRSKHPGGLMLPHRLEARPRKNPIVQRAPCVPIRLGGRLIKPGGWKDASEESRRTNEPESCSEPVLRANECP
jgi:hypothetical protein